ncbi:hypothetical protein QJS10_CPA09g00413 [Acorus calamus]|uniref:Reverse transcriptase zinc-binding domain-containing protein n=1 Tax=Acorus calamus TaxID=4465 RepID=A0AAV9E7G1_ACOCL|nr:hypothetical protein QJS10_CPA09g00413 [Acorus calamus]
MGEARGVVSDPARWRSPLCKGFFDDWPLISEEFAWQLGEGVAFRFWDDRWCGARPLCALYPRLAGKAMRREGRTRDFWSPDGPNGGWDIRMRRGLRGEEVQQYAELLALLQTCSLAADTEDELSWAGRPGQDYSVKVGYAWWNREAAADCTFTKRAEVIWQAKIPLKVKCFVWFLLQNRLVTKVFRARWRPSEATDCPLCRREAETIEHLFCQCPVASKLWAKLVGALGRPLRFRSMEELWEEARRMRKKNDRSKIYKVWLSLIPADTWAIWTMRNDVIFKDTTFYFENLWEMTRHCIKEWGTCMCGVSSVHIDDHAFLITA